MKNICLVQENLSSTLHVGYSWQKCDLTVKQINNRYTVAKTTQTSAESLLFGLSSLLQKTYGDR